MHVEVFDVLVVGLLIVVGAEASQAFIAQVCFNGVYTADEYI